MSRNTQRALARFLKWLDVPVESSFDGNVTSMKLQGLPFQSLNAAGFVDFWRVGVLLDMERFRFFNGGTKALGTGSSVIMMFANTFTLHPALHNSTTLSTNMTFLNDITEVGNTSFVNRLRVINTTTSEPLITSYKKLVNSNQAKHTSVPIDAKFKEICKSYIQTLNSSDYESFPKLPSPANLQNHVYTTEVQVYKSEYDVLFHTNQASYLKFCLDATAEANEQGKLKYFDDDLMFYPCKESLSHFIKQTFAGDTLKVYVYQENAFGDSPNNRERCMRKLKFKICDKMDELVFHGTMTFYNKTQE